MRSSVTVVFVLVLAGAVTIALGQETRSSQAGVYSESQARDGAQLYREACGACHKRNEFAGPAYMDGWSGRSAADLFGVIRDTMPEEAPGSLSREETVALLAHLFEINGMPAGDAPMPSDPASLQQIRIEGPYKTP